jgi:hypothetical protein
MDATAPAMWLELCLEWAASSMFVGYAGVDVDPLIDGEGQGLEQRRLADEHQVMRTRKVLAEQPQLAQALASVLLRLDSHCPTVSATIKSRRL